MSMLELNDLANAAGLRWDRSYTGDIGYSIIRPGKEPVFVGTIAAAKSYCSAYTAGVADATDDGYTDEPPKEGPG